MSKIKLHFPPPKKYEPKLDIIFEELTPEDKFNLVKVLDNFGDDFWVVMGQLFYDNLEKGEEN